MTATCTPSSSSSSSIGRPREVHGPGALRGGLGRLLGASLLLALVPLGTPAGATSTRGHLALAPVQQASLSGLEAALQTRLAASPAPEVREAIQLEQALASLRAYTGLLVSYVAIDRDDPLALLAVKRDVDRLRSVAGHVQASATPDDGIRFQMAALGRTLGDFGIEARQAALRTLLLLVGQDGRARVRDRITRGEALGRLGQANFGRNYATGALQLARSAFLYHTATALGDQLRILEAEANPVDLQPMAVELPPETVPMSMMPFDVMTMVNLTNPAPEVTVAVRAVKDTPEPSEGSPPPPQVTLATRTFLDVPAGTQALPVTVEIPPFTDESVKTLLVDGGPVAVEGNTAVIGRPNSRTAFSTGLAQSWASILERNEGGFGEWNEVVRLDLGINDSLFGLSVSISGDTIVIGAPGISADRGAAYVYERQGDTWALARTLLANDGAAGDLFGSSVAIDGDWILVGAPDHESGPGLPSPFDTPRGGTAYTFQRAAGDPTVWSQVDSLAAGLESASRELICSGNFVWPGLTQFGSSVAICGDLALVGDPDCRVDYEVDGCSVVPGPHPSGAAFVFERVGGHWQAIPHPPSGSVRGWLGPRLDCSLSPCTGADVRSRFGASVAIADGVLIVGAPNYSGFGPPFAGAVRVYAGPPSLALTKTLNAPSPMAFDQFGSSVAVSRHLTPNDPTQMIVVGSPGHDHPHGPQDAGSTYVFVRGHAPGCPEPIPPTGGWGLLARRVSENPIQDGSFGRSLAVSATTSVLDEEDLLSQVAPTTILASEFVRDEEGNFGRATQVMNGMEPVLAGQYWLETELDPFDRILEAADDGPDANIVRSIVPITFCVPALDQPDLAVDSVELVPIDPATGKGFVVVARERDINGNLGPAEQRTRAGLNVTARMAGMFDGPLTGARLTAMATWPGYSSRLGIWNQATHAYEPDLILPDLSSGDTISLQLDVQLLDPASLPSTSGGYPLNVQVTLAAPSGVRDVDTANNAVTQADQNLRVLVFQSCNFAEKYGKQLGNGDFNVTVDFMGALNLDAPLPGPPDGLHDLFPGASLAELGASGGLSGGASLTLMGHDIGKLADFRVLAERDPAYTYDPIQYPGMDPGYQFFGFDVRVASPFNPSQLETIYGIGPYDTFDTDILLTNHPQGFTVDLGNGGFTLDKAFTITKGYEKEKTFYPGGFPVTVGAGAIGQIGFHAGITVADALRFDVGPIVDFSATVLLAAGPCDVLCVGAEGEITLVKDTFDLTSAIGVHITPPTWIDAPDPDADHSLGASACFHIQNTITLLDGRIQAFAIFPWIKFCRPLGFPVPCGIYLRKVEFPIVDWLGLASTQVIVERSINLCCTPVVGILECANSGAPCSNP